VIWAPDNSYLGYTVYDSTAQTTRGGIASINICTLSAPMPVASHANNLQVLSAGF